MRSKIMGGAESVHFSLSVLMSPAVAVEGSTTVDVVLLDMSSLMATVTMGMFYPGRGMGDPGQGMKVPDLMAADSA